MAPAPTIQNIFDGMGFRLAGLCDRHKEVTDLIVVNGGHIYKNWHKNVQYLIVPTMYEDVLNGDERLYDAYTREIPIIKVGWIDACIKNDKVMSASKYMVELDTTPFEEKIKEAEARKAIYAERKKKAEAKRLEAEKTKEAAPKVTKKKAVVEGDEE